MWPLIPLLRLGDTNGAVMGFQVKCTISTKIKIDKAIEQDTTDFIEAVGPEDSDDEKIDDDEEG